MTAIFAMLMAVVMVGCKKDEKTTDPPGITSVNPINNATGIVINSKVSATFGVAMDSLTITTSTFTLKHDNVAVTGTIGYQGTTATFTPAANLSLNTKYTATVTSGVKNLAGTNMANDYVWSFTTGVVLDNILPTVITMNPLNNATGVGLNSEISATFSEPVYASTVNTTSFTLKQGTTAVAGTVTYTGTTATFAPTANLLAGKIYTATVTTDIKDLAGNAIASNNVWSFTTAGTQQTLSIVNLGAADNYVILAKTAINNISTSAITGNLGLSPAATSYITGLSITNATGYAISAQVTGKLYAADMADPTPINLTTAVSNMITAYNDAAGRPLPDYVELGTGNIGGKILTAGLYKWTSTVTIPADVIISGNATDVWIFQIAGDLTMGPAAKITVQGGALAKNIFWQVAGQAVIGTTAHFEGVLLSMTAITFQTGASINGRALAQTAVILDGNTVK